MIDLSVTEDDAEPGTLIAHTPTCPVVDEHRQAGRMVATLFGCEVPKGPMFLIAPGLKEHECLRRARQ